MTEEHPIQTDHPVSHGNVTYLGGSLTQVALGSIASSFVEDADRLAETRERFIAVLRKNGRPCTGLEITYGMALHHLLRGEALLSNPPFRLEPDSPAIVEAHGNEISGWWCVVEANVMMRVRFSGNGDMSATEVALALTGGRAPDPSLVAWLEECEGSVDVSDCPAEIRALIAHDFSSGKRPFMLHVQDGCYSWYEGPTAWQR